MPLRRSLCAICGPPAALTSSSKDSTFHPPAVDET
jgi:hypothetical protein